MVKNYNKEKRASFTKNQNLAILKKFDKQLNSLKDENSKFVKCSHGSRILIDNDVNLLYYTRVVVKKGYIECCIRMKEGKRTVSVRVGRAILQVTDRKLVVDHINRNPLDNRRSNLRICTQADNLANRVGHSKKTKYKGLSFKNNSIKIELQRNGIRYRTTVLNSTEAIAATIYDCLALKHVGEYALTNFDKSNYNEKVIETILTGLPNPIRILDVTHRMKTLAA